MTTGRDTDGVRRSATVSGCGKYRYALVRTWGGCVGSLLNIVMLNPSTADAQSDDPTIRKCIGFARRLGYSGIYVTNLFAFRSTDPGGLFKTPDPVGPDNDVWLSAACEHDIAVCAWGATGGRAVQTLVKRRLETALPLMQGAAGFKGFKCFGYAKSGAPRHPLMLAYSTPLICYQPQ